MHSAEPHHCRCPLPPPTAPSRYLGLGEDGEQSKERVQRSRGTWRGQDWWCGSMPHPITHPRSESTTRGFLDLPLQLDHWHRCQQPHSIACSTRGKKPEHSLTLRRTYRVPALVRIGAEGEGAGEGGASRRPSGNIIPNWSHGWASPLYTP